MIRPLEALLQATVLFLLGTTVAATPVEPKREVPMAVNLDRAATTRWLNKPVLAEIMK